MAGAAAGVGLVAACSGGIGQSTWLLHHRGDGSPPAADASAWFVADTLNAVPPIATAHAVELTPSSAGGAISVERSPALSRVDPAAGPEPSTKAEIDADLLRWRGEHFGLIDRPGLRAFPNQIRDRLLAAAGLPDPGGEVYLTASPVLAPHATRHGNILMSLAWLQRLEDEDQFAALIAVELAHGLLHQYLDAAGVTIDRGPRAPEGARTPTGATSAAPGDADPAAARVADPGVAVVWGRRQWRDAALLAQDLLVRAGYDPFAIDRLLSLPDFPAQATGWPDSGGLLRELAAYRAVHHPHATPIVPSDAVMRIVRVRAQTALAAYGKAWQAHALMQSAGDAKQARRLARDAVAATGGTALYPNWVAWLCARSGTAESFAAIERAFADTDDLVESVYYVYSSELGRRGRASEALDVAERGARIFGASPQWSALQRRWQVAAAKIAKLERERPAPSATSAPLHADARGDARRDADTGDGTGDGVVLAASVEH